MHANAQDIKDAIGSLGQFDILEIIDKDGDMYHIQKSDRNAIVISVGKFRTFCTEVQVWDDSVLKFRNGETLVAVFRGLDGMSYAIAPLED